MNIFIRSSVGIAIAALSLSAFAALPQPGLWVIDNEVNGSPGRGLQIDRQDGKTIIVSYYGYKDDGSAIFYQSVGEVSPESIFNADLIEYKNGIAIGGPPKNGEIAKVLGKLNIDFKTNANGVISLPGEENRGFSRFVYQNNKSRFNNVFRITTIGGLSDATFTESTEMRVTVTGDTLVAYIPKNGVECSYTGSIKSKGSNFYSIGRMKCPAPYTFDEKYYVFDDINVDEFGVLNMKVRDMLDELPDENYQMRSHTRFFGVCVRKPRPYIRIDCKNPDGYMPE